MIRQDFLKWVIKGCPFCGGPGYVENLRDNSNPAQVKEIWFVRCGDCGCYTREFQLESLAIEAWNRRDSPN